MPGPKLRNGGGSAERVCAAFPPASSPRFGKYFVIVLLVLPPRAAPDA